MSERTIQERLRSQQRVSTYIEWGHEAADTIDRLESALATARREALEEAINVADTEPELPGHVPQSAREALDADPVEFCRAVVRTTKKNISTRIRALISQSVEVGPTSSGNGEA